MTEHKWLARKENAKKTEELERKIDKLIFFCP